MTDQEFMNEAYAEAKKAFDRGEYPVGALLVQNNIIVARNSNMCVVDTDPTAHAEILVIREAYKKLKRPEGSTFRDCVLYTTLFPCPMCEKTIVEVGIPKVVYGATSFKWIREYKYKTLLPMVIGPIMENECRSIFQQRLEENGRTEILSYEAT